jgi:hypothetical protein
MSALFKNNATALLAASISTSGTTLVLAAGTGIKFPVLTGSDFFYGTLYDSSGNYEIVKVTARASDSLTIVRAQEGTTALAFSSGNAFAQRLTAAGLNDFAQKSADNTFSGNNTFSGTNTYTTSNTFSGTFAAANPTFTGTVTIPTPTTGDSTTKAASTAFVTNAITTATGSLGTMSTQNKTAVDITGGTIVGITDLAVADGGTGSSSLTANSVMLGNGTSALSGNMVAPGATGRLLVSNGTTWTSNTLAASGAKLGLGITGETWNYPSRSFNSLYTNSYAYPIAVSATATCAVTSQIHAYVNGNLVAWYQWQYNGCGSFGGTFIIVPPGATYQLDSGQGLYNWAELY